MRSRALVVPSLLLIGIGLVGCAPQPSGLQGASERPPAAAAEEDVADGEGAAVGDPVTDARDADGMPEVPVTGCDGLVDYTHTVYDANTQWTFEFLCSSRDAFDTTTASLLAAGYAQPQKMSAGDEAYVSDWNHFIAESGGVIVDVDLKIEGAPDDIEYDVIVTATPAA